jgi:hypothetical protein
MQLMMRRPTPAAEAAEKRFVCHTNLLRKKVSSSLKPFTALVKQIRLTQGQAAWGEAAGHVAVN